MTSVADHWASWGFPGKVEDDGLYAEQMGCVTKVYEAVQKAMLLGAVVNLVHNETPSEARNKKAKALTEPNSAWIPKPIQDAVQRLK